MLAAAEPGKRLKLHTHHLVREDLQALYGFRTADELGFFGLLLTVTGVGPQGRARHRRQPPGRGPAARDPRRRRGRPDLDQRRRQAARRPDRPGAPREGRRGRHRGGGRGRRAARGPRADRGRRRGRAPGARLHARRGPRGRARWRARRRRERRSRTASRRPSGRSRGLGLTRGARVTERTAFEHPCETGSPRARLPAMTDALRHSSRPISSTRRRSPSSARCGRGASTSTWASARSRPASRCCCTAARQRGEAADHVLLHGPPGLGKTTLATIIARELGVNIRYTSGPAIERAGDLAAILTSLDERDVLFIDEIHRLNRAVEEILYPAMEDYALDVMIGKGPSARSLRLTLRPFTIVGATTRAGRISGPLRDRFGAVYRLDFYADDDLVAIVRRSARILGIEVSDEAAVAIAGRGRATPRIVNRLLRRVRDHAEVHGDGRVSLAVGGGGDGRPGDRRARPRRHRSAAPGRDHPEVRRRSRRRRGARRPSSPRRSRRSRTSTSRSCSGSGSWTARRRAGSRPIGPGPTWPPSATTCRRAAPSASRPCGRPRSPMAGGRAGRPGRHAGRLAPRRGGLSSPVPGAARFEVLVPPPADGSTRARLGRLELAHGIGGDTHLHAGRHERDGQGAPPRRPRGDAGAAIILANTYHLYLRPGHERIARLGGLHRVHGLGPPDPHRLGWLPGRLARRPQRDRRRRGHVPQPPRRVGAPLHAGIVDRDPGGARSRRRRRLRPAGPARVDRSRATSPSPRSGRTAGPSGRWRRTTATTRPSSASSRAASTPTFGVVRPRSSPAFPSTGSTSAASPATRRAAEREAVLDVVVAAPRRRPAGALPDGARLAGGHAGGGPPRGSTSSTPCCPARVARNAQLWVPGGRLNLRNERFRDDPRPIQEDCRCLACRRFSRAYLAHLFRAGELLAYRLATCHNLTFTLDFMAGIRSALRAGTFPRRLPELRSLASRPSRGEVAVQSR